MLRKNEIMVVLFVGAMCFSAWGTETRTVSTRDPKTGEIHTMQVPIAPKEADPFENTSVLVEAFVVRVSNAAIAEAGVNPISQSPEGISILKILWCLEDQEKAQVISGAKLMARHKRGSESSNRATSYIKSEKVKTVQTKQGPVETKDVRFDTYDSGVEFNIRPWVMAENIIGFEYSYLGSGVNEGEDTTMPPDRFSYEWSGYLAIQSGKPVIAGAVQGQDNTTFLILTATVQENAEKK